MDRPTTQAPSAPSRRGSLLARLVLSLGLLLVASACTPSAAPAAPSAPRSPASSSAPASHASPTGSPATSADASTPADPSDAPSPSEAALYPMTLTDDEGTEVALPEEPERVISLSPANTEILFTLGVGDKVVGGTDFDDFPPEAAELPDVATFTGVLIEQVVDLEPDLVIAAGNAFTPPADIDRLRDLGLRVMVVYAEDVPAVLEDIQLIGTAVGAADEAARLTAQMQTRLDAVTAAVGSLDERPRVFYQIGSEPEIYGPAPDSFVADLIGLAGGEAITTDDPAVFSIPVERLVKADPEVIVVGDAAYGVCPGQVKARPAWRQMTAVREDAVRAIDDLIVTRPGPRLAEGLAALAVTIHPELELTPPPPPVQYCR